jgi:hypothetical protein
VGVTAAFLAKVEAEVRALEQSSGAQEAAIAQLPASTRAFCEAKGRLYLAIKDINSAGQALHAGDLESSRALQLEAAVPDEESEGRRSGQGDGDDAGPCSASLATERGRSVRESTPPPSRPPPRPHAELGLGSRDEVPGRPRLSSGSMHTVPPKYSNES